MGIWDGAFSMYISGVSTTATTQESNLDVDKIKAEIKKMSQKHDRAIKGLSLGDKYKLDDTKSFFAKLDKRNKGEKS